MAFASLNPADENSFNHAFATGVSRINQGQPHSQVKVKRMISVQFDHLHVKSRACEASARFYTTAFGASVVSSSEVNGHTRIVLELGGVRLFIEDAADDASSAPAIPAVGLEHIGLQVADLDEVVRHLEAVGIELAIGPRSAARPGVRMAFLHGPDGEYIELIERRNV